MIARLVFILTVQALVASAATGFLLPTKFTPLASPTNIAGAILWLDASTLSAGAVSTFSDLSGNGNHCYQSTGSKQPTAQVGQNGLMELKFDKSNNTILTNATLTQLDGLTGATIFFASKTTNAPSGNEIPFNSNYRMTMQTLNGNMYCYSASGIYGQWQTVANGSDIRSFVFNGNGSGNAQRLTGNRNGSAKTLTYTGTQPSSYTTSTGYLLGDFSATPTVPFSGVFYEMVIYNRALTAIEISQITAYLNLKWNIY